MHAQGCQIFFLLCFMKEQFRKWKKKFRKSAMPNQEQVIRIKYKIYSKDWEKK